MPEPGTPAIPTPSGTGISRLKVTPSCCRAARGGGVRNIEENYYGHVERLGFDPPSERSRNTLRADHWGGRSSHRPEQGIAEGARDRVRDVGLPVPLLQAVCTRNVPR